MAEPPPIPVRYVILLELLRSGPHRASDLVEPTELTLQGVSYNLKQLAGEGLVAFEGEDAREARITEEGIEALHDHFLGLKAFVDLALSEMLPIEECVALAQQALQEGDEVGLFMEDGRLVARQEESPSMGHARTEAAPGELVVVSGLSGVVDLAPGSIDVVQLPPPRSLPGPDALLALLEDAVPDWDVLAVAGLEAEVLVERADLDPDREPIPFAAQHVARSAASVGLDVLVVAAFDASRSLVDGLREQGEFEVTVHELPAD